MDSFLGEDMIQKMQQGYEKDGYPDNYPCGVPQVGESGMIIEAKRFREVEEIDENHRALKRMLVEEERTEEWFDRMFEKYMPLYRHATFEIRSTGSSGYITDKVTFRQCIEQATTLNIQRIHNDVLDDFSYLFLCRSLTYLYFREMEDEMPVVQEDSEEEEDDRPIPELIPLVLRGKHLEETSVAMFRIQSDRYKIVGVTDQFAYSLKKIVYLYLDCPLHLLDFFSSNSLNLSSLEMLSLGISNVEEVYMKRSFSTVGSVRNHTIPYLKEVVIHNCDVTSLNLHKMAPNVEDLSFSYCHITSISKKWYVMHGIKKLRFSNTSFSVFDVKQFQPFSHLEKLTFSNHMYNDDDSVIRFSEEELPRNTFSSMVLYNIPQLKELSVTGIILNKVILGKPSAPSNLAFANLKILSINPATQLSVRTLDRYPSTFLPSLKYIFLHVDDRWSEEEDDDSWYEQNNVEFPLFLLGIPTLKKYKGSYRIPYIGNLQISLDAYANPAESPYTEKQIQLLSKLIRRLPEGVSVTATNLPLLDAILAAYRNLAQRLETRREQDAERLERERLARLPDDPAYLEAQRAEAVARTRIVAVGRRRGSGDIRIEPYFIKYNIQNCTGNPFALNELGIPLRTCLMCAEAFTLEYHEAEKGEDINNDFMSGEKRQEVLNAAAAERPETFDGKGLGCVVVCNFTASDFEANMLHALPNQTTEQAVSAFQHSHYNHFYHRVCYSKFLILQREDHGWTQCPETEIRFFPSAAEMEVAKK